MFKILSLIVLLTTQSLAVDSIYTWGYGEDVRNILSSIKFFTGNATYLIDAAIMVGLLLVFYKESNEGNMDRVAKMVFLSIIVSQLFFHSTKDYMVEDEVTNQAFAVTDIPVGVGELFSIFTNVERILTEAFESSFSTPNSLNYSQVGLGFSMVAHLDMQKATFASGYAHETFMDYTTNCIASGMLDESISSDDIIKSENILQDLRVVGYETIVTKAGGAKEQISCQDCYDNYITTYVTQEVNDFIKYHLVAVNNIDEDKKLNALQDTSTLFTGITKDGQRYVKQFMVRNMLKKGLKVMAMTTGGDTQALAYASAVSESTLNNQWQQAGIMAQSTLPMIKAYLTSVILAMTPLLALLAIMFGDWKYIKMIITLLITLMLFSPLASIINFLIYSKLEKIIPLMNHGLWMPMVSSGYINQQIISYLNFLGYAAMSIPLLAYSLVKASEMGFVNFMSSMGGSVSGAANAGANQKVTGVNIGNTRVASSSVTAQDGVTTSMGGGATQNTKINEGFDGGAYEAKTTTSANGNTMTNFNNAVGSFTSHNGELSGASLNSLDTSIANGITASKSEAYAKESSALESINNTVSEGINQSLAKGQIYTDANDFSENFGTDISDSRSLISGQQEAIKTTLQERLDQSRQTNTTEEAGFRLAGRAGWNSEDSILGFTGLKIGTDGSVNVSGTSTNGESFSLNMSKDDGLDFIKTVGDTFSKILNNNEGLALRASKSLADNEVFSDTNLKADMEAYSKAHSTAEKLSNTFGQTENETHSFNTKNSLPLIEKFIENSDNDVLKGNYNYGGIHMQQAVDEASIRMTRAALHPEQYPTDYNILKESYKDISGGYDISTNQFDTVNNHISTGKNLDENVKDQITSGHNNISSSKVSNTIDQDPTNLYNNAAKEFKDQSNLDMENYKKEIALNTEKHIEKGGEIIQQGRDEAMDDSRMGKALSAIGDGARDIGKGLDNLDKPYRWESPGSDGVQEMQNNQRNWNNNMNTIFGDSSSTTDLADIKNQVSYLKDEIQESQYEVQPTKITPKGK